MKYKIGQKFIGYGTITALFEQHKQYSFGGQIVHERVLDSYQEGLIK